MLADVRGRVSIAEPPGSRSCGGQGGEWLPARGTSGATPWYDDLERLKRRFPSDHSRASFMAILEALMEDARLGRLPSDLVVQMTVSPDVLELKLPDWTYSGGKMHTRLYFSEPRDLPGHLVALRLQVKRPGPIGVEVQTEQALAAGDLLLEFEHRGFE